MTSELLQSEVVTTTVCQRCSDIATSHHPSTTAQGSSQEAKLVLDRESGMRDQGSLATFVLPVDDSSVHISLRSQQDIQPGMNEKSDRDQAIAVSEDIAAPSEYEYQLAKPRPIPPVASTSQQGVHGQAVRPREHAYEKRKQLDAQGCVQRLRELDIIIEQKGIEAEERKKKRIARGSFSIS